MPGTPTSLTIKTREGLSPRSQKQWNLLAESDMQQLMQTLELPALGNDPHVVSRIISGIPNPLARALIFKYAFTYDTQEEIDKPALTGVFQYFRDIKEEWKALIACLAIYKDRITVKRVYLSYEDGKDKRSTTNVFGFLGALGNMLFEERDLWTIDSEKRDEEGKAVPFIDLIRFANETIGAASPHSLVFTNPNTNWSRFDFFNEGLFRPLNIGDRQLHQVYLYLLNIERRFPSFQAKTGLKNQGLYKFIVSWREEIEPRVKNMRALLSDFSVFASPYDTLLNTTTEIGYLAQGTTFVTTPTDKEGHQKIAPSKLLLPATNEVVEVLMDPREEIEKIGVHLIEIPYRDRIRYFVPPITAEGLSLFGENLEEFLLKNKKTTWQHNLDAEWEEDRLKLILHLTIDGKLVKVIERTYAIHEEKLSHKVAILWPNFKSENWKKYYFYSELIHNLKVKLSLFPLVEREGTASLIVKTPESLINQESVRYEIYESEQPFLGAELRLDEQTMGYMIARGIKVASTQNFTPARIGIDFGSTNTCVSFAPNNATAELLQFKNRRLFLCGTDEGRMNHVSTAKPDELFFFQNEEPFGIVRSMVAVHNRLRINVDMKSFDEVAGGIPVFEKNISVRKTTASELQVEFDNNTGVAAEIIKYNMKWQGEVDSRNSKTAYLKTLWLKICAELFQKGFYADQLVWSYPLAMTWNHSIITSFADTWEKVAAAQVVQIGTNKTKVSPYSGGVGVSLYGNIERAPQISDMSFSALTESEAVCLFALSDKGGINPRQHSLAIGFDMGGSTTDVLIIGNNEEGDRSKQYKLLKQSSVKVAANKLSEVARYSNSIQQILKLFCERNQIHIYGIEDINAETAGYLMNILFDRLAEADRKNNTNKEADLYAALWSPVTTRGDIDPKEPKGLFTIAAYVSGLTIFYAGQLVAQLLKDSKYSHVDEVDFSFYGNGGKLYDWFRYPKQDTADQYYKACFAYGLRKFTPDKLLAYEFKSSRSYQKNEVSLGLSSNTYLKVDMNTDSRVSDILGEEGYIFEGKTLTADHLLNTRHLLELGNKFKVPKEFPVLKEFLKLFYKTAQIYGLFGDEVDSLIEKATDSGMRFTNYIQNTPDFVQAQKATKSGDDKFDYVASPFILQGMAYLDNVIIPHIYSNGRK